MKKKKKKNANRRGEMEKCDDYMVPPRSPYSSSISSGKMNASLLFLEFFVLTVVFSQYTTNGATTKNRRPTSRPKISAAQNETQVTGECPEEDGFFADAYQCDKYYVCRNGVVAEEKLCPDGFVFNDFSPIHEKCDLPFSIDCSQRAQLQEPHPTDHCPRLNGYFQHEDAHICNKFYYCVDGKFNLITCPDGLVYNERIGICSWPDEAKKKGCTSEELFKFTCPKVEETFAAQHPRYADPDDCQFFYVCINGETPRRSGCKLGQVFNEKSGACDWPRNVPECRDWYKGVLTDEELEALEHPPPKAKPSTVNGGQRRQKPKSKVAPSEQSET